jgi:hypothetical protein
VQEGEIGNRKARGERAKGHAHKGFKIDRPGPDRAVACLHPLGSFDALSERYIFLSSQVKRGVSSGHVWGMCLLPSFFLDSEVFDTSAFVI